MKRILFTGIMLLSFAAAQASNNVGEAAKSKMIAPGKKEVVAKQRLNDDKALSADKAKLMITCYGLTCTTYCREGAITGDIEAIFDFLEAYFC